MRKAIRYLFRTILVFFLMLALLIVFMLNPKVVYARKHSYKQLNIYSRHAYPPGYDRVIEQSLSLVSQSELYNPNMNADIFLNDGNGGSVKWVLKKIFGDAMAWGYHNNVILSGTTDQSLSWLEMNGYKRHLARTIAHELIHCYEFNHLGWLKARPVGNIAVWKWEGYAEYVSYRSSMRDEKKILADAIRKYEREKDQASFSGAMVDIDEGESIAGKDYFRYWIMVKYLMDIKHAGFDELIKKSVREDEVYQDMIEWVNNVAP